MLEQLFGSRTRVKLLRFFLSNQDEAFYVRELTRKIDEQLNSVRRELANLQSLGMIIPQELNDKKFFKLNKEFVLRDELKALLVKSQLLTEQDLVKRLRDSGRLRFLALTGYFTGVKDAPTDIIIVGKVDKNLLSKVIQRFQKEVNREINYTVLSTREYNERHSLGDKFLLNILNSNKIVVVDDISQED